MDKYKETADTWNKVASRYEAMFMNLDLYDDSYDSLLDLIPLLDASLLEIGCGPGNITSYLLSKRPTLKIHGIDVAENMVKLARKNNPSATFLQMDCRSIDHIQDRFNAIVCGFCIPYLSHEDCSNLLMNCNKLLVEQGLLYLSFVEGQTDSEGFISGSDGDRTYFYYYSHSTIDKYLKLNAFETVKSFTKNYAKANGSTENHLILIARKIKVC